MRVLAGEAGLAGGDLALVGRGQAGQEVGEHGLARAARADQRDALSLVELEVDAVEDERPARRAVPETAGAQVGVCPLT